MTDFRAYEPKEFFEKIVKPTYEEYLAEPLKHHRVKNAVAQLDTMAERMWHWWHPREPGRVGNALSPRKYRQYLSAAECSDFQIVWDLHDNHKHVEISRQDRIVTSAAQSGVERKGGAFDPGAFQNDAFDVGVEKFVVKLDDGQERDLSEVLENVAIMWRGLI